MECVAGWSCGFGTYSPIQLPVITKGSRRDPICRWELLAGAGIGTTMAQPDKEEMGILLLK